MRPVLNFVFDGFPALFAEVWETYRFPDYRQDRTVYRGSNGNIGVSSHCEAVWDWLGVMLITFGPVALLLVLGLTSGKVWGS